MKAIVDILVRKKQLFFIIGMLSVIGTLCVLPFPKFTGNLDGFSPEDNTAFKREKELDLLFGGKEKVYLVVTPNSDSLEVIFNSIESISQDLKSKFSNAEISTPKSFYSKMIRHWKIKDKRFSTFLKEASEVPLLQQLISRDKSSFLIVFSIDHHDESTANEINKVINKEYQGISKIGAMSTAHLEAAIKKNIEKDVVLISGLILVFFLGFIMLIFRNFLAVVFTFANIVISLSAAFVLFYILGYQINIISILVIPITLILSMSDALHLLAGHIKNKNIVDKDQRLRKVVDHLIIPSFFSSATTAAAFFSFYLFNDSQYIREFGLITSIALMIEFLLTFAIAPFLLYRFNIQSFYEKQLNQISTFFLRTKNIFSLGFILLILISIPLSSKLKFQTNSELFFPRNSEIREVHDSLKKNYHSFIDLSIYVSIKKDKNNKTGNDSLYYITKKLTQRFEKLERVIHVNSATEQFFFKSKIGIPVNLFGQLKDRNPYYNADKNLYKIQVQFKEAQDIIDLKNHGLKQILEDLPNYIEVSYSSNILRMDAVNASVASSLIKSFSSSGFVIFLMMLILSRSFKIALYSLIPNIAPIAFVVVMYFVFGMHINILTAITAVICLGLLDDDTVHIIYRKIWLKEPMGELSFSILSSAVLLNIGFLLFMFSSFEPIRVLGWVSAIIFTVGVVCEMTLMQWVLERVKIKKDV